MTTKAPEYKNVHDSVLALEDDHKLSRKSVRGWIKHQRELAKEHLYNWRKGLDKKGLAKSESCKGYIRQLEYYLANGDYVAPYWGDEEQHPVMGQCLAMAFDEEGFPKRTIGVFYPDMGMVWTKEMDDNMRFPTR